MHKLIYNKKLGVLLIVIFLFILSQWFLVKLVYDHKINGNVAEFLSKAYYLKAGIIKEEGQSINIYLGDFFANYKFAKKLLAAQAASNEQFANLQNEDNELSQLVWSKLLKQAWLYKVAAENNLEIKKEDVDYYIEAVGGEENVNQLLNKQGISMEEYRYFLIEPDLLEVMVYNYLLSNFADNEGVAKIQEAYMFLESEKGENWSEAVEKYNEDEALANNTFWLSEDELTNVYEAVAGVEVGGFSKIVQVPGGYVIWHVNSMVEKEGQKMREIGGLFIYAKAIDDFFDDYLNSVEVEKKY